MSTAMLSELWNMADRLWYTVEDGSAKTDCALRVASSRSLKNPRNDIEASMLQGPAGTYRWLLVHCTYVARA